MYKRLKIFSFVLLLSINIDLKCKAEAPLAAEEISSQPPINQSSLQLQPKSSSPEPMSVSATKLDSQINETLQRPEFSWRLPRQKIAQTERGLVSHFIADIIDTIKNWFKPIKLWLEKVGRWIEKWLHRFDKAKEPDTDSAMDWRSSVQIFVFLLLAIVASILAIIVVRAWKQKKQRVTPVQIHSVAVIPDLAKEDIQADQLPFDEWESIAQELLKKGELRLAMRAFYLSVLAYLAYTGAITIAQFKSNRDYLVEFTRRTRDQQSMIEAFSQNIMIFENSWYGMHEINTEILSQFTSNQKTLRTRAKTT